MGWIHYFSPFLPASSVAVVRLDFLSYIVEAYRGVSEGRANGIDSADWNYLHSWELPINITTTQEAYDSYAAIDSP